MIERHIRTSESGASYGVEPGSYHLVVDHPNHAGVMSPAPVDFTGPIATRDFTGSQNAAYTTGPAPMKDLGNDDFGMFACDINHDGQITASDFNRWLIDTKAVAVGYISSDCNLDAQATATDFNLWLTNTKAVVASQVPR